MADPHEELLQQLNQIQATQGVEAETRKVIGLLGETIDILVEEIDELQQRVVELEEDVDNNEPSEDDKRKTMWYSER
ncbi:hypothetical protein [Haladaptatus sp. CMAA 1911]|uniref:hypothetical protein n=1 Tax=unclassified Haladaptatus TaxID=2622732 RepID=UPI00375471A6